MNDTQLTWLAIALSIIGLVGVYIIVYLDQPVQIKVNQAGDNVSNNVVLVGQISDKFISDDGHVFIKIQDETGKLDGIVFNGIRESLSPEALEKDRFLQIYGTIELYKGKTEIIIQRINPI